MHFNSFYLASTNIKLHFFLYTNNQFVKLVESRTIRIVDMKLMMMTTVDMVRLDDKTIDKIIGSNLDVVSKTFKKDQDKKLSSTCAKALISEALTQQQTINRRPYIPDISDCSKEKFAKDFSDDASNHEKGSKKNRLNYLRTHLNLKQLNSRPSKYILWQQHTNQIFKAKKAQTTWYFKSQI